MLIERIRSFVLQRALYPQLTSIYQCVNRENHEAIHHLLANRTWDEQSVICTWNLPRGKRPSRTHTESKVRLLIRLHLYHLSLSLGDADDGPFHLSSIGSSSDSTRTCVHCSMRTDPLEYTEHSQQQSRSDQFEHASSGSQRANAHQWNLNKVRLPMLWITSLNKWRSS